MIKENVINWAVTALEASSEKRDYACDVISSLEVAVTDYSTVIYLQTTYGAFYVKRVPAKFLIEIDVINFIRNVCNLSGVPELVVQDKEQRLFITKASGAKTVRKIVSEKDFGGVCDGSQELRQALLQDRMSAPIQDYMNIQKASEDHINELLKMGINDWRLNNFSTVFADFLNDKDCIEKWNLPTPLINSLRDGLEDLEGLCHDLDNNDPRVTLNHCDFQDNNIIYNSKIKETTIIDWSEVAITHPLLSRISCLESLKRVHGFDCAQLKDHILSDIDLVDIEKDGIYKIAQAIACIYYVLCLYELYKVTHSNYGDRAEKALNEFIHLLDIKNDK